MDITSLLRRYLTLKNNFIPSIQQNIQKLEGDIFTAEATLKSITDEKVFLEDFKWKIRTRRFTIFNLIYLPSCITFAISLLKVASAIVGIVIVGTILETVIRNSILNQNIEFEDTLIYPLIKAFEDSIYFIPSIPAYIFAGLLIAWLLYSFRQVRNNEAYYTNVVIPENQRKNALVPDRRRKQQLIVDDLKNNLQSANLQLFNYQKELQEIKNTIVIPSQYWTNDETLIFLTQKLEQGQAKTLNDALNLWDKELQTRRVEKVAKEVIRETKAAEKRVARQQQEHYNQIARDQQERDKVQKQISEELKRRNERDEFYDNVAKKNGWL